MMVVEPQGLLLEILDRVALVIQDQVVRATRVLLLVTRLLVELELRVPVEQVQLEHHLHRAQIGQRLLSVS
jgi:hypothetical protein